MILEGAKLLFDRGLQVRVLFTLIISIMSQECVVGGLAAITASSLTHPIDVVKVRLLSAV